MLIWPSEQRFFKLKPASFLSAKFVKEENADCGRQIGRAECMSIGQFENMRFFEAMMNQFSLSQLFNFLSCEKQTVRDIYICFSGQN